MCIVIYKLMRAKLKHDMNNTYKTEIRNGRKFVELFDGWAFYTQHGDLVGGYSSIESAVEASLGW